ncbi:MAG: outer membrane protein assembly factor BamD [Isosphaeraceae bacterium]|nr:outer membrane protein assembly factor BamD [Isosphaeraceae bacterium]
MALDDLQPNRPSDRTSRATASASLALAATLLAAGCSAGGGPLARLKGMGKGDYANGAPAPHTEASSSQNLMSRWLTPSKTPHTSDSETKTAGLVLGEDGWAPMKVKPDPEADGELAAAQKDAQEGRFAPAEAAFARIAKKRKGTPWGEKAQFYLAESQFKRGQFVNAHDSYEILIKDYPGTDFLDELVKREYEIGITWLAAAEGSLEPDKQPGIQDRIIGKFPVVDTGGHGIKALEHVRLHDPIGPLSDDAAFRTAEYYAKIRDYETAALYYDQLITDHPKSPLLQKAQLASIDAKLKAYIGPKYDGRNLESARDLVKMSMTTFPEKTESADKLYKTLDVISDQEAERAYRVGDYYMRTGKVTSAEYYFGMVIAKWPKNEWAKKAKENMAVLAKMERKTWVPSTIMAAPSSTDQFSGGQASSMGPNGLPNAF